MTALETKRAQFFQNLWDVPGGGGEVKAEAQAWSKLLNIFAHEGFLHIFEADFPQRITTQLYENAFGPGKRDPYAHIFNWLLRYGQVAHLGWREELERAPLPSSDDFERELLAFFGNLSHSMLGRQLQRLTPAFWPWFVGVLELATHKRMVPNPTAHDILQRIRESQRAEAARRPSHRGMNADKTSFGYVVKKKPPTSQHLLQPRV